LRVNFFFVVILSLLNLQLFAADTETTQQLKKPLKLSIFKVYGPIQVQNLSKKKIVMSKNKVIKEDIYFEVGENAQVEFLDGNDNQIVLMSRSSGNIQFFQEQQMIQLEIHNGNIRIVSRNKQDWLMIKTPLSNLIISTQDVGVKFDRSTSRVEVLSFKGSNDFRALQSEEFRQVTEKKKAFFQGIIEEGEILYDLLLHGKKIPKGLLSSLIDITAEDQKIFKIDSPDKERLAKMRRAKNAEQNARGICKEPRGEFNQCAWTCLGFKKGMKGCMTQKAGVSCERTKCNANGEWSDKWILPLEIGRVRCQTQVQVGPCDY
jgi:hypothetical protein